MINFPDAPTLGEEFTDAGIVWTWDGEKWTASGLVPAYLPLTDPLVTNAPYLRLAGGTMIGAIELAADPVLPLEPVTLEMFQRYPMIGSNRIINGDMLIDQRNNGAQSLPPTTSQTYIADRWAYGTSPVVIKGTMQRNAGGLPAITANGGFPYFLTFTSTSAYVSAATDWSDFHQALEADMITDFQWGTPTAQPVTLSFWVYASQSGTFGGCIKNYAQTRCYPFTYQIPVINTWIRIVLTIPGDTIPGAGIWVTYGNAGALYVVFDLGSGTTRLGPAGIWATTTSPGFAGAIGGVSTVAVNGASINFTGVKLETGIVATPFARESLAKRLADCKRYYQMLEGGLLAYSSAGGIFGNFCYLNPAMRAQPTLALLAILGTDTNVTASSVVLDNPNASVTSFRMICTAIAAGYTTFMRSITASSEL
jgi:hypothetical protein